MSDSFHHSGVMGSCVKESNLEVEFLSGATRILITDESSHSHAINSAAVSPKTKRLRNDDRTTAVSPLRSFPLPKDPIIGNLHNAERVSLTNLAAGSARRTKDPLSDGTYLKIHRRAERQEKQLRNIEKERAQHEKVQLERLLEELQGPDWLKTMGISGITDTEKKLYEPTRNHFIREVSALINKFRLWKEEEKRRKIEKEQVLMEEEAEEEEDEEEEEGEEDEVPDTEEEVDDEVSEGDPPALSDVDAWAARQLHHETKSATATKRLKLHHPNLSLLPPPPPPPPEKPITSFYSKPYLRAAAVGKQRRGRNRTAWGHPVPEVPEHDFRLPSSILNEESVRARARNRRRIKREGKDGKSG